MSVANRSEREHYQATISVLTPFHGGKGDLLHRNVDYLIHDGSLQVYRLSRLEQEFGVETLAGQQAFQLAALGSGEKLSDLAAYRLAIPSGSQLPSQVREFLRDPFEQPYLSSGALRSALSDAMRWRQEQPQQDVLPQEGDQAEASTEGKTGQGALLGKTSAGRTRTQQRSRRGSRLDPLGALTATDCYPSAGEVETGAGLLRLLETGTWGQRLVQEQPARAWLECLPPQTVLTGSMTFDERHTTARSRREPSAHRASVAQIVGACQARSEQVMNVEHEWWRQQPAAQSVVAVYDALQAHRAHAARENLSTLLWLGWGTRWHDRATETEPGPRPGAPQLKSGPPRAGQIARRQVILSGGSRPAGPLGWVRLTLSPRTNRQDE